RTLNERLGAQVWLKAEGFQRGGAFKFRGAYNAISRLPEEALRTGVAAFSSGNHAQAVAISARLMGTTAVIVMPEDTPAAKLDATAGYDAEIVTYDRYSGDREAIARKLAAERGAELVPSYDHADIIAGQGTVGLELMRQCAEQGHTPDQVLIPCGGGGLSAGSAVAIRDISPATTVHPVEPEGFDDTRRSLAAGERLSNDASARSICDALQAGTPGAMTFPINRRLLGEGLVVSDEEVREAMRFAFRHLKLVIEPGGAVALAAVLAKKVPTRDKVTVVVLSGGNVDPEMFAAIQGA
ncbi:MAG TPA: threonine/serine dehydratase, partial [Woeseiaceae bacterium]|nr:threonine/serine dehydratase [Woeseiaceae bacterium]